MPDASDPRSEAPTAESAGSPSPLGELVQTQRERDDYLDQLQRTRAEFANFQKRSRAQADLDRQYAVGDLARELLPVLDNFERALDAARKAGSGGIVEGLELVHRQLLSALAKHGVEPIAALGQPFDPNQHDALLQQPDAGQPEGTVVAELSRGYRLRDRVLRPSQVAVSTRPDASA